VFKACSPLLQPTSSEPGPLQTRRGRDAQADGHLKASIGFPPHDSLFEANLDHFLTNTANGKASLELFGRLPMRAPNGPGLPSADSDEWKAGLTWKGVFFRLLDSHDLDNAKNMLRNLASVLSHLEDRPELLQRANHGSSAKLLPALHVLVEFGAFGLFATPVLFNSSPADLPLPFSPQSQTTFRRLKGELVLFSTALGIAKSQDFRGYLAADSTPGSDPGQRLQ